MTAHSHGGSRIPFAFVIVALTIIPMVAPIAVVVSAPALIAFGWRVQRTSPDPDNRSLGQLSMLIGVLLAVVATAVVLLLFPAETYVVSGNPIPIPAP